MSFSTVPGGAADVPVPLVPAEFGDAVAQLQAARLRPEVEVSPLPAPAKLAPFSHALSAQVAPSDERPESASGRFVLLHDPNGLAAWDGTLRIVVFLSAEMEPELARDPLLPDVAWSWLTDCLEGRAAEMVALGGTVTATSSTRFGDIAGPHRNDDLEIRASWTVAGRDVGAHLQSFGDLLAVAAGLPPEGVAAIGRSGPSNVRVP
ncbi:DUF3000 domain-containing protein [Nakamurella endophytica]|uniref:Membrane protein n=1 Tax=Nakamurella endophytica TaxID=1748367 RepID=A0A917TDS4_9ACTN|nr:DUF3000 domain-containing protein [Nakamurella endophytica]GGM16930.1 membrane protein [Nakamurella endophytica]